MATENDRDVVNLTETIKSIIRENNDNLPVKHMLLLKQYVEENEFKKDDENRDLLVTINSFLDKKLDNLKTELDTRKERVDTLKKKLEDNAPIWKIFPTIESLSKFGGNIPESDEPLVYCNECKIHVCWDCTAQCHCGKLGCHNCLIKCVSCKNHYICKHCTRNEIKYTEK